MRIGWNVLAALALAIAGLVLTGAPANAIPAFASQTGQPCTACHIGGYGPQLTPLGRKPSEIGGYTQSGGEGLADPSATVGDGPDFIQPVLGSSVPRRIRVVHASLRSKQ